MHRLKLTCKPFALAGLLLASSLYGQIQTTRVPENDATTPPSSTTTLSLGDSQSKPKAASTPEPTVSNSTVHCTPSDSTSAANRGLTDKASTAGGTEASSTNCVDTSATSSDMRFNQTAVAAESVRKTEAMAREAALNDSLREHPAQVRITPPYHNLQSLNDLYTQVPSSGAVLRRFGSDAFLLDTGNANNLPSDLPVGPD